MSASTGVRAATGPAPGAGGVREAAPGAGRLERWLPWGLGVLTFVSRLPFFGRYPTEWDSVQLVMGVDHFDVTIDSPHAPGYWLYVASGRLVRALTTLDAHRSLLVLAALASAATVAVTYLAGRELGGRFLGLTAAALLLFSPSLWFYGAVVGSYAFDAVAAALLLLLALRARPRSWHGVVAAGVLGLAAGFRQTSLLVLGPLALAAAARSLRSLRAALAAGAAGVFGLAVWVVPMVLEQPGGAGALQREYRAIWKGGAAQTSVLLGAPADNVHQNTMETTGESLAALSPLLPVALAGGFMTLAGGARGRTRRRAPRAGAAGLALLVLAVVPSLAFLYLFHFGKSGYVLSFLPPVVLLLLWPAARVAGARRGRRLLSLALAGLVAAGCLFGAQRFLYGEGILPKRLVDGSMELTQSRYGAPYRVTAHVIRAADEQVDRLRELEGLLDPRGDVIVFVWGNGQQWLRHVMLTMPDFWVAMIVGDRHDLTGRHLVWRKEHDRLLEVPRGGRAVLVVDRPPPELGALVGQGRAEPVRLSGGLTAWAVRPGSTVFGLPIAEVPPEEMGPAPVQGRPGPGG